MPRTCAVALSGLLASLLVANIAFANDSGAAKEGVADPPPKPARLNNDEPFQKKLSDLLKQYTPEMEQTERIDLLYRIRSASFYARDYATAEKYAREILKLKPKESIEHSNLSVYLGKQGKFKEAETEAREAIKLDPGNSHAFMVLASWEWHLRKREKALQTFKSVVVPEDPGERRYYEGCKACFYASVGDEKEIEAAISKCLELDDRKDFFERDIIFDPYRGKDWFIKLVGETLAKNRPEDQQSEK